jgi:sulfite exporter TauE/SafE
VHPHFPPAPPPSGEALRHQLAEALGETTHRAQRAFVVVNAVPFMTGIMLSCFTDVPAVSVHGHLTLGLVWGILQCGLFVASAWWYETRSTRSGDPLEESLAR